MAISISSNGFRHGCLATPYFDACLLGAFSGFVSNSMALMASSGTQRKNPGPSYRSSQQDL
jgi:hypothetical protein